jgi:hypothetical protein
VTSRGALRLASLAQSGAVVVALVAVLAATVYHQSRKVLAAPADPPRPPQHLSETGLYSPDRPGVVEPRNRAFAPQYPLWSDGLTKRRWVQLPEGMAIDASNTHEWRFPVGTRFWKEFSHDGRKVETRLLWRATAEHWVFATYVWNDDGTDAVLVPEDGIPDVVEVAPGRRHSIPSRNDCRACHGTRSPRPLGFNALQLSTDRDPNALHAEPLQPGMLTVRELVEERRLTPERTDLLSSPPRIRTANPATRSVLGYLAANCGVCHNGRGEIAAVGPTIRHEDLLKDADAVASSLAGQLTTWQIPGTADGTTVLIHPGAPEQSALFVRMRSRSPSSQMPPLGTVVRDQKAVDTIFLWIKANLAQAH